MAREVRVDKWGYEVNTSSDSCISAINSYYHQVLSYGRRRSVILESTQHDPDCVLANILVAHFLCSSNPSRAHSHLEAAKNRLDQSTQYEKEVFDAVSYLISPDRDDDVAVELHLKLLKDFPRDLMSLKRAQVLCFYMGRADLSLNLVQQVLPANQQEDYVYGMLAFPLLELGRMDDAAKAAKKGYEINREDTWAQHGLCHVLQYECRFKEAVEFMEDCSKSWSSLSSFMYTHNWWHVALCYLEGSSPMRKVLEVYDSCIWKELERNDAMPVEVYLNAVGLLLRVYVRGEIDIFGDRLNTLACCLADQANWYLEWHLDVLIAWALAATGKFAEGEDLIAGLKYRISNMTKKKNQVMQRGMLLAEALFMYGKGNYKESLKLFDQDFDANNCKIIGASEEQLDVFNEVWYVMMLQTGQATKAVEVIEERIKKREGAPFMWRLLEKGYSILGRSEATTAGEKAKSLECTYFK